MTDNTFNARSLARKSADAYMADNYGDHWVAIAEFLLERVNFVEAEAILRSKHMRWARDASNDDTCTLQNFVTYYGRNQQHLAGKALADLVEGTFG